jgi:nucleotidyltransferase/DNA polymerase involved in DNA repair
LARAGLRTVGQLAALPPADLAAVAGARAAELAAFARGIDRRPVVATREPAKSYGAQHTFDQDTCDLAVIRARLRCLADDALERMRQDDACARTIEVRIRYCDMDQHGRSDSLAEPSRLAEDFYPQLDRLLDKAWDRRVRLRLVGVKFSAIYHGWPTRDLLYAAEGRDKRERLQAVVAEVRGKYGGRALMRGHDWQLRLQDGKTGA